MSTSSSKIDLFSFHGKIRTLHLTWFAFFLSFAVWFNHAPLMAAIRSSFGLTDSQVSALLMINVALTIPARIVIGMLVDQFGPKLVFSILLFLSSLVCFLFAFADNFQELIIYRFLLGFVGAGFVIGIRMIGEWFPARQVGLAEGIYGGWGNFGSAAAALLLPSLALLFGGDDGWRYAVATTGALILVYAVIYYLSAQDTPEGSTYFKPNKAGGLEVTSKFDFWFCMLMNIPLVGALCILTWRLTTLGLLNQNLSSLIYLVLFAVYAYQSWHLYQVNKEIFKTRVAKIHRYKFKQVAILNLAYLTTFGSELAVVSMLPLFFLDTFDVSPVLAGMLAAGFAFMNLVSRPFGGWFSDKFGRRNSLLIALCGLCVGYIAMSQIDSSWAIPFAVMVTMFCSFFVQAGEGAVFAMVPLVRRRLTGQIAGMVGAYGNVGAITFLAVLSFATPKIFFTVIAFSAIVTFIAVYFLDEPEGEMVEVLPDGTVQVIELK
ncbi:MAG: MFS transporter [SAR86 cluster bacterium]|uniref:Nitrate/nitrite transporter n=1 Tax=SAR86 cluster bacterium TaxID=2030880 RepID=A0A2A4XDS4_9GAMM|nr:MAG: MFS transporter [SAR86 cluster bacterium]